MYACCEQKRPPEERRQQTRNIEEEGSKKKITNGRENLTDSPLNTIRGQDLVDLLVVGVSSVLEQPSK